jgi:predicted dehydrogenase
MNRRSFLSASAAAGLLTLPGPRSLAQSRPKRVAVIGPGWYGKADLLRLIQVEPVEVVALADPDSQMLSGAADLIAERQKTSRKPVVYRDYRDMLEARTGSGLIATPDHWHALAAIDAMKAGADLYLQKPISVDIVEGQAIVAAAQKYKRVVQVGTQRRSTPHLIEARDRIIREGKLGHIGLSRSTAITTCARTRIRPTRIRRAHLDWDLWTGPAPLRKYNRLAHPGSWRAFMEYGNGIVGDMCIHMLDMVRWMLNLGWPKSVASGRNSGAEASKANITDTQTRDLRLRRPQSDLEAPDVRGAGRSRIPLGRDVLWRQGDPEGRRDALGLHADGEGRGAAAARRQFELEQYPEDKTEARLERHVAPGHSRAT